ncbi:MAG TPA: sugar phosphate isomerase/epimerase [Candidatus Pullichristensenella excrementigallinarum]|uniref:Sugar phosphate isomerase/epimerase n=1 Tax=Candidatus Pullichristensenella excrementigallinarum TaxID=2840907 RepID=A0A9D1LC88_9FIRM|nr:sugar phosphate isomerase/epimerase [Candidatus Pullichristensenella excrementigallinarum]
MKAISIRQFAAMNMIYNRHSFSYFLDSMEKLGISNFELWTGSPHPNNFVPSLRETQNLGRTLRQRGLHIVCLTPEQCLYPHNIAVRDDQLRAYSVKYFTDYLDMAGELGVDKMLCCAGWGDYDEDVEEAWKRSMDSLEIMLRHAHKAGVELAFEILCPSESNLVYDLATTKRMMEHFQDDLFRLCVDTVPIRLSGSTLEEFFETFGKRICHVHLTDGTPTGHIPTGLGEHPVAHYLEVLQTYEYDRFVTLEIGNPAWLTKPHEATEISFNTIQKLLKA